MATLAKLDKVVIKVYGNDHLPPHFHVIAPDFAALVEIETLEVIAGQIPSKTFKAVCEWAKENKAALTAEWNRLNPNLAF